MNYESTTLGFIGGFTGQFIKSELEQEKIKTDFIEVQAPTRINIKLKTVVAGGLTQFWDIAIPAPHGGIFVVPLSNHPLLFLVALLIGTIISAVILGLWKQKIEAVDVQK